MLSISFTDSSDCRRQKRQILSFKRSKSANLSSLIDKVKADKENENKGILIIFSYSMIDI